MVNQTVPSQNTQEETISLSRSRKILFSVLTILLVYLFSEATAWLAYRVVFHSGLPLGQPAEFGNLEGDQDYAMKKFFEEAQARQDRRRQRAAAYRIESLHPYLGFVRDPDVLDDVSKYGFPLGTSSGHLFTRSKDRILIGIFGGSVGEQLSRDVPDILKQELLSHPYFAGKEILVIPYAMGGYKQPQQLMVLNYILALGGQLDIVINIDGYNEVVLPPMELIPRKVFYAYPRLWPNRFSDIMDPTVRSALGEYEYLKKRREDQFQAFSKFPLRYSPILNWIWRVRDNKINLAMVNSQRTFLEYQSKAQTYLKNGPQQEFSTTEQQDKALAELWRNCSIQMFNICTMNDIQYYHFLQPNQYVPGTKPMSEEEKAIALNDPIGGPLAKEGYPYLIEAGKQIVEQGVPYHDLTNLFQQVDDIIYRDSCCHYNIEGNTLLCKAIAEQIIQSLDAAAVDR